MSAPSPLKGVGPTKLADIQNLASPAHAPIQLRFSAALTSQFQSLWRQSFLSKGAVKERGGTLVADQDGNFSLQQIGGHGSTGEEIHYNLTTTDQKKFKVVGTFHTHPYPGEAKTFSGGSFSGGDIGLLLIDASVIIEVMISHGHLFAHVQTSKSPTKVDQMAMHQAVTAHVTSLQAGGKSFEAALREANRVASAASQIAYYEGKGSVVTKV